MNCFAEHLSDVYKYNLNALRIYRMDSIQREEIMNLLIMSCGGRCIRVKLFSDDHEKLYYGFIWPQNLAKPHWVIMPNNYICLPKCISEVVSLFTLANAEGEEARKKYEAESMEILYCFKLLMKMPIFKTIYYSIYMNSEVSCCPGHLNSCFATSIAVSFSLEDFGCYDVRSLRPLELKVLKAISHGGKCLFITKKNYRHRNIISYDLVFYWPKALVGIGWATPLMRNPLFFVSESHIPIRSYSAEKRDIEY